jgi:hypothetical protein
MLPLVSGLPSGGLLAYVGMGPGQEFIPQFLTLLALAGTALMAVLQWPFVVLFRRLRRSRRDTPAVESKRDGTSNHADLPINQDERSRAG